MESLISFEFWPVWISIDCMHTRSDVGASCGEMKTSSAVVLSFMNMYIGLNFVDSQRNALSNKKFEIILMLTCSF